MTPTQIRLVRLLPDGRAEDALDDRSLGFWEAGRVGGVWRISVFDARRRWIAFQTWAPPGKEGPAQTVAMWLQAPGR
jgi:hypothetical protein